MNDLRVAALALDLSHQEMSTELKTAVLRDWRRNDTQICDACGGPAYMEDTGNHRFSCPHCGYTTTNPNIHFSTKKVAA